MSVRRFEERRWNAKNWDEAVVRAIIRECRVLDRLAIRGFRDRRQLGDRMLSTDPAIKRAFDAKIAADPAFAANPDARLAWLYAHAEPGTPTLFAILSRARSIERGAIGRLRSETTS